MPKRLGHFALVMLLAAGCGGPRISKLSAGKVIEGSPDFKAAKLVYLPRKVEIPAEAIPNSSATREGEALNIVQIASVDPVVAILRARDRVTIEDFVSAVEGSIVVPTKTDPKADSARADSARADSLKRDSTKIANDTTLSDSARAVRLDSTKRAHKPPPKPPLSLNETHTSPPPAPPLAQAWVHTLRVTPRSQLQGSELAVDDGDDNPESPRTSYNTTQPIGRTPGWTLSVGAREFVRVLDVGSYSPALGDPPGQAQVDFLWRWKPTKSGAFFDTESAEFESLPHEVQQAAQSGAVTVDATIHWARATVARDGASWKVTSVKWAYGDDKPHEPW
jgi:hypothetical protein